MATCSVTNLSQSFISDSLAKVQLFVRTNLVNRLKTSSKGIHIISGPSLYGKTSLAYQYASSLDSACVVCWLHADKRNFMASLEKKNLFRKLCMALRDADVIILDDLPEISSETMRPFVFLLQYLQKYGCRILITTQSNLLIPETELEVSYITIHDLLFTDAELKEAKEQGFEIEKIFKSYCAIPFIFSNPLNNIDTYVMRLAHKENPVFKEIYEALLLCVGQGSITELEQSFGKESRRAFKEVGELPHCGFNEITGLFDTIPLSDFQKCSLLKSYIGRFTTLFELTNDEFISRLISIVANRVQYDYAIALARTFLSSSEQVCFFREYARACDASGYARTMVDFVDFIGESNLDSENDYLLYAQILGNAGDAKRCGMVLSRLSSLREESFDSSSRVEFSKDFTVNILNGFRVERLGESFPQKGSIRTKARLLLTLLVLNHNRELSKTWLAHVLWPDSEEDKCRQNFYNIWSYTKKLFERGKGNCPYFISSPYSVRIDERYIDSDVINLEQICTDLINLRMPSMGYEECLEWIETNCSSGELLPGTGCPEVVAQSRVLQSRLVDALVAASENLMRQNRNQLSFRYAECAFSCDKTREDACFWYMKFLKAFGWYSKAINAFNEHRTQMIQKYGVESSKRIVRLYEEILEELS